MLLAASEFFFIITEFCTISFYIRYAFRFIFAIEFLLPPIYFCSSENSPIKNKWEDGGEEKKWIKLFSHFFDTFHFSVSSINLSDIVVWHLDQWSFQKNEDFFFLHSIALASSSSGSASSAIAFFFSPPPFRFRWPWLSFGCWPAFGLDDLFFPWSCVRSREITLWFRQFSLTWIRWDMETFYRLVYCGHYFIYMVGKCDRSAGEAHSHIYRLHCGGFLFLFCTLYFKIFEKQFKKTEHLNFWKKKSPEI